MATLRHHIYSVREKLKSLSDDELLNNELIKHLLNTKRDYLLQQKYSDYRRVIPDNLKQTIEIELESVERVPGVPGEDILVSKADIPTFANLDRLTNELILSGRDFIESYMNFIPYPRFLYVGKDRWLKNMIYGAIRNRKLYLKSGNFTEKGIEILNLTTVFADPEKAYEMSVDFDPSIDYENTEYPLTGTLADTAVEMVCQDLLAKSQIRQDEENDANPN